MSNKHLNLSKVNCQKYLDNMKVFVNNPYKNVMYSPISINITLNMFLYLVNKQEYRDEILNFIGNKDYLSYKEIELLTQIEEASNDIAKTTNSRINDNINRQYDIYDALKQPFKKKIQDFSDDVGIQIIDNNLESVVFDYYMENFEELSDLEQSLIKYQLHTIDECIKKLRKIVAWEPVYSDDLIPFELRIKKYGIDVKADGESG